MKCKECRKIIPDGFTDCPWCGAAPPVSSAAPTLQKVSSKHLDYIEPDRLGGLALLLSLSFLFGCSFLAITRDKAANPFANPAYFRGRWFGTFFWAIVILLVYSLLRNKNIRASVKFLLICAAGFLLGLLTLGKPSHQLTSSPNTTMLRPFADDLKNENSSNKWNAPGRALLKDLVSFNQQYVSEVAKLDLTAKPLYTPESFRDAATARQMIDQLHARLAVAEKYANLDPVLAKMNEHVAAVNASESEKQEFLEGFESTVPKTRATFKDLKGKERAWLQASIDLYQFVLTKTGTYTLQDGNLVFKRSTDSDMLNQKLAH